MESKCPVCHSANIRNDSVRNDNGVIGPGYKSWVVEEKYSCNDCGVYFKPVTEKALNLAIAGHGKPERRGNATGPRWVKAVEFKHEVGMPYHAKDSRSKGAGHFNSNGAFIWGDCTVTHPKDQDDLYILDEQPAAGIKQINREWLCDILIEFTIAYVKSTNKDIANDAAEYIYDKLKDVGIEYVLSESEQPAAGREGDAVEFAKWATSNHWRWIEGLQVWKNPMKDIDQMTTAELYKLFKQQKENNG